MKHQSWNSPACRVWSVICGKACGRTEDPGTGCFSFLCCWLFCGLPCLRPALLVLRRDPPCGKFCLCNLGAENCSCRWSAPNWYLLDGRVAPGVALAGEVQSSPVWYPDSSQTAATAADFVEEALETWLWSRILTCKLSPLVIFERPQKWPLHSACDKRPLSSVCTGYLTLGTASGSPPST